MLGCLASATAQTSFLWDGGASPDGNWSGAANWNPDGAPANNFNANITFDGVVNLGPLTNNLTTGTITNLTFNSGAGSFTLTGNQFTNRGNIINNSGVAQTINMPMVLGTNAVAITNTHFISTGSGSITNGGQVTAPANNSTLAKIGTGTLVFTSPLTNILGQGTPGGGTTNFVAGFNVDEGTVIFNGGSSSIYSNISEVTFGRGAATANKDVNVIINSGTFSANNWLGIMRGSSETVLGTLTINGSSVVNVANWSGCFNAGDATRKPRAVVNHNGTSLFWINNNATGNDNFAESLGSYLVHTVNDSAMLRCGSGVAGINSRARVGIAGRSVIKSTSPTAAIVFGQMHLGDAVGGLGMPGGAGAVYNRGLFTNTSAASTDHFSVGSAGGTAAPATNGYGYFLHDSATPITLNEIGIGGAGNGDGVLEIKQGTININNWITIARGQSTTAGAQQSGLLMIRNGTMVGPNFNQNYMIQSGSGIAQQAVLDVGAGGKLGSAGANHQMNLANANNALSSGTVTLSGGGVIEITSIFAGQVNPLTSINFNNGTLKAMANTATFLGNNLDGVFVHAGGATIDSAGFNVSSVPQLQSPSGNGITSIPVATAGAGYIGRPIVRITDATGIGATAIAEWSEAAGTVTGVTITSPGSGYSAPTVTLVGGGYTNGGAATLGAAVLGSVSGGSVTKTGAGTLTLINGATYSGTTTVNGGALALNSLMAFGSSTLTITNAALNADVSGGGTLNLNNLTLQNNATNSISFGNVSANPTFAAITASGTFSAPGTGLIINIDGFGLQPGQFSLIDYTGAALGSIANFSLGTLPPGVVATLSNNVANTSIDIVITSSGQNLSWYGLLPDGVTTSSNWDINATTNWVTVGSSTPALRYQEYTTTTTVGDPVRLDDTLYNDFINPQLTNINLTTTVRPFKVTVDSTLPYSIRGAGGLTGAGSIVKSNTGSLTLGTSNSYSGGTFVYGGTLAITNDNNLGAAAGNLTLAGGTLQVNANVTNTRPISILTDSPFNVASGATAFVGSKFTGTSRTLFRDLGTAIITNAMTFPFHVSFGTVIFDANAKITNTSSFSAVGAGTFAAENANLIIRSNAIFEMTQDFNIGDANDATGRLDIQNSALIRTINLWVGKFNTTVGRVFQTGGTLTNSATSGSDWRVGGENAAATTFGGYYLSGGRLDAQKNFQIGAYATGEMFISGTGVWNQFAGFPVVGRFTNGVGTMVVSGGQFNQVNTGQFLIIGEQGTGTLVVSNTGIVNLTNAIRLAHAAGGVGTVNLDAGGRLITPGVIATGPGISATLNLNGGTLKANASSTAFIQNLTSANVLAGGAVIDTTNNNITIGQALLNGGGGLTKVGTGALTLTGTNNYAGTTAVSAGRVLVSPGHNTPGAVTVADTAGFGINVNAVGSATVGNMTLGAGAASATTLDVALGLGNPSASVLQCGTITVNGTNTVRLSGIVTAGTFPIVTYTGAAPTIGNVANAIKPAVSVPQGMSATVSNYIAGNTLYVIVTGTPGIVWTGTNSTAGLTSLWNINSTTNWLAISTPTFYMETNPPGDAVFFTDVGNGVVLLTNTVSPASVTISNPAVGYSFSGAGKISGTAGITKLGAGNATMSLAGNDYTGNTTINGGTLTLGSTTSIPDGAGSGGVSIGANGTMDVSGLSETINGLSGSGNIINSSPTASTLTVGNGNGSSTWSGTVPTPGAGTITLIKTGTGSLTISGTNYFGGTCQLNGGTNYITATGRIEPVGAGEFWIQQNAGTSTLIMDGGSLSVNNWFVVGRNIAGANGTLILNSGTITKTGGGNIVVGSLNATGTMIVNGGKVFNNSNLWLGENAAAIATLRLNGGLVQATQVRANNGAASSIAYFNGGVLQATAASGDFIQAPTIGAISAGGLILDNNGFDLTIGTALVEDVVTPSAGGGVTKIGNGVLNLNAANNYTGNTVVSNGTLNVNGTVPGTVTVRSGATLGGNGTINGVVTVDAGGKIGAGNSIGNLNLSSSPVLNGSVVAEVDRNGGTPFADIINVASSINYSGTLVMTNTGADLQVGDTFTLFNATGYSGSFSIVSQTPNQIVTWNTSQLTFNGTISVATVAPAVNTTPGMLVSSVVGNTLNLSWSPDRLGWTLSSNAVSVASPSDWHPVAGSTSVTNLSLNINTTRSNVFFRLVYP